MPNSTGKLRPVTEPVHCFGPDPGEGPYDILWTLCGKPYTNDIVALLPDSFANRTEDNAHWERCPDCANHPDLPLLVLGSA